MAKEATTTNKRPRRTPFLKSKLLFWVLLIIFFPLGLFVLWRYKPYEYLGRSLITVLTSFILFSIPFGYYYYQDYEQLMNQKAAEQAVIDSDPLYGYVNEDVSIDQASFLKYHDQLSKEIDTYKGLDDNITALITLVQKNRDVNIGVMLAHLDTYKGRLNNSIAAVNAVDLTTFSPAEKDYFAKEKQTYLNILQETAIAYDMLEKGIGSADVDSLNGAKAIIAAKNKELLAFKSQLKKDAERLKISTSTKKPLVDTPAVITQAAATIPAVSGSTGTTASLSIKPPMPRSADNTPASSQPTAAGQPATMTLTIDGTTIEGDVVSIY